MEYLELILFVISNLKLIWGQIKQIYHGKSVFGCIVDDSQQLNIFFEIIEIGKDALICTRSNATASWMLKYRLRNIPEITSVATAKCLEYLLESLAFVRSDKNMSLENISLIDSKEFRESDVDSNIICIGGPNANAALKSIFEQGISEFPYEFKGRDTDMKIVKRDEDVEWPPSNEKEEVFDDYGLLLKAKSGKRTCIFVLAGLGTEATMGVGYYLKHNIAQLDKDYQGEPFGVVVGIRGNYRSATRIDGSPPVQKSTFRKLFKSRLRNKVTRSRNV